MRTVTAAVSRDDTAPLVLEQLTLDDPRPDEIVVEVAFTGICHTDIYAIRGKQGALKPAVFGHEGVGIVAEVGSAVTTVAPGDRVIMTPMSCGGCPSCLSGAPAYCRDARALNMNAERPDHTGGFRNSDVHSHFFGQSSFATFSLANRRNVIKVPDDIPLRIAAALGCGVMTGASAILNALAVTPGTAVLIMGTGAVGLSAVMAAKIAGASRIVGVDTVPSRLSLARELGATDAFLATEDNLVERIRAACNGGANYALEASGNPAALRPALDSLAQRGTCVIVGAAGLVDGIFRWRDLQLRGATIRGSILGDANPPLQIPQLFQFHREGRFPIEKITTHFDFDQINHAIQDADGGGSVKPVLRIASGN